MPLFLDACALVKRYVPEGRSSSRIQTITNRPTRWGGFFVSSFVEIEVVAAIAKAAREYPNPMLRPKLLGEVPDTVRRFQRDYRSGVFNSVDIESAFLRAGVEDLTRHPHHSIGAADALHLVTALDAAERSPGPLVFVTADRGLYDAAREHGLLVYNPNTEHEAALELRAGL